VKLYN